MNNRTCADRLVAVLGYPQLVNGWNAGQWSELVATARYFNLLGSLSVRFKEAGVCVPGYALRHLTGAQQLSERQHRSVLWEVHQLQTALGQIQVPVLLLKGSAYVMAGYAVGRGRLFGDIDILVPRNALGDVESQLMLNGWVSAKTSAYDQRYYREWMHEIPPMRHMRRSTVIDVHHTILPLTARYSPDPSKIISRALPVLDPCLAVIRVPCQEDLVIHSITHLVHEGELHNGLRDLNDIDCMLRNFEIDPGFWDRLCANAIDNDLSWPVLFGLQLVKRVFDTPVPVTVLNQLTQANQQKPSSWLLAIFDRALRSNYGNSQDIAAMTAQWLVYVRSHILRMPLHLVLPHLARKAWMRRFPKKNQTSG